MRYYLLVVAALLLVAYENQAAAADRPEHPTQYANDEPTSKKTKKIIAFLKAMDINDPEILALVAQINSRSKDGYLNLHEETVAGGSLKLRYALEGGVKVKQLELRYAPDDSNYEYTARTNAVMAKYKLKF